MTDMIRRHSHLSTNLGPIVQLYFDLVDLKNLYRQGWLKRGMPPEKVESVADHSFGVALLGYIIASEYRSDLDSGKVMQIGLFHDLGEALAGDYTPSDRIDGNTKFTKEEVALREIFSRFSSPERYIDLWLEFEHQETPEARFVKGIDRLEMGLQAYHYERLGYTNLDDFFPDVKRKLEQDPCLSAIFAEVIAER